MLPCVHFLLIHVSSMWNFIFFLWSLNRISRFFIVFFVLHFLFPMSFHLFCIKVICIFSFPPTSISTLLWQFSFLPWLVFPICFLLRLLSPEFCHCVYLFCSFQFYLFRKVFPVFFAFAFYFNSLISFSRQPFTACPSNTFSLSLSCLFFICSMLTFRLSVRDMLSEYQASIFPSSRIFGEFSRNVFK